MGCSVIGWGDAVACLAAIVTVTIVHCTVRVIIWKREEVRRESEEGRVEEREGEREYNGDQSSISDLGDLHWLLI